VEQEVGGSSPPNCTNKNNHLDKVWQGSRRPKSAQGNTPGNNIMAKFKPGDLVVLKSGGPVMTVESIDPTLLTGRPGIVCVWFAGAKRETAYFEEESIELAPPKAAPK
jgi:uncharacterized protein YodC (DUF2158 family)